MCIGVWQPSQKTRRNKILVLLSDFCPLGFTTLLAGHGAPADERRLLLLAFGINQYD